MIKIVWLSPYNINKLQPEIKINRQVNSHSCSWIHTLSESLALNKEIELHIITHTQVVDKTQHFEKNGIHYHVVKYSFPFTKRGFPWFFPLDKLSGYFPFSRKAKKIILDINPDIIHVHGTESGYFIPSYNLGIPCIISIQGIISKIIKYEPTLNGYLQLPFEQKAIKRGKYFGCRTNFDSDFVRAENNKAVIFDLPEAMNSIFFEKRWNPASDICLLFIGTIIKRKGIENLLLALIKLKELYPTISLRIIGSGDLKYVQFLKNVIDKNNLQSNVVWLGSKSSEEIALELSKCTFFVLPSFIENSPNSLAEAMAVGVPSIATKVGGIPSMIEHMHDGMLYDKDDIDGLVNIIHQLIKHPELQKSLSRNAQKKAYDRNFPQNVTKKYIDVYKSLVK